MGAEAAFFCAFCLLVFLVFFGLLSPIVWSFLKLLRLRRFYRIHGPPVL